MPNSSRIQLLPDEKFWATYLPLYTAIKAPSPELHNEVYDELQRLDGILRHALDMRWGKTNAYYTVSDDWNVCWHHSMSVCCDEMCCGEFLDIVQQALAQMKRDWCFHASLECDEDMGWGLQHAGRGQIFFYRGTVIGNNNDKFDYTLFDI